MRSRTIRTAVALLCAAAVAVLPCSPAHADRIRNDQWHLRYLHVAEAHKISQGEGVIVAVIDTGVDPHPDLRNNLLPGTDIIPGGKGDGRQDRDSHGTGMAGLIAAHGQPGDNGALGIAPKAKILPVLALPAGTAGNSDQLAAGIRWAVHHGATVISVSSGGGPSPALRAAVQEATDAGAVLFAAAGNNPVDFGITFPAFLDQVVAVGAIDRNGNHAAVSVTGTKMAIAAPGVDIYSTSINGKYRVGTGTSDATAIVAGAAALVRSKYPNLSAQEVVHRLTATAVDKGAPGRDDVYGYGVVDLVAALTADIPPLAAGGSTAPSPTPTNAAAVSAPRAAGNPLTTVLITLAALLVTALIIGVLLFWRPPRRSSSR